MALIPDRLQTLPARLAPLLGPRSFSVIRLSGTVHDGSSDLTALYLGNGTNREWLQRQFFRQATGEELCRPFIPSLPTSALARDWAGADLQLTDLPPVWSRLCGAQPALRIPAWIRQQMALPPLTANRAWPIPRPAAKEVERLIRRHDYSFALTRDAAAIRHFFHAYYEPYVRARYGTGAMVVSLKRFMRESQGGELAQLRAGREMVAGMMLFRRADRLRLGWFGCRAGARPPNGASEVLDALVLRHAWLDGVRQVSFGSSRPCLADGAFRYKRRLGASPVPARFPQAVLGIGFPARHPAVLECLRRRPMIGTVEGQLRAYRVRAETGTGDWVSLENIGHGD
ncbi:MAG: GNAT family N-acetyltransferase [Rhodobacteraceae bacterium]|nr:GNAT family N-acetyltransferase [Paracoccaceae bacterium]